MQPHVDVDPGEPRKESADTFLLRSYLASV